MRIQSDPLQIAERIVRQINTAGTPQAVFRDAKGRLDVCAAHGVRHEAMLRVPRFANRVVGVFAPGVSVAELAAAVRAR